MGGGKVQCFQQMALEQLATYMEKSKLGLYKNSL